MKLVALRRQRELEPVAAMRHARAALVDNAHHDGTQRHRRGGHSLGRRARTAESEHLLDQAQGPPQGRSHPRERRLPLAVGDGTLRVFGVKLERRQRRAQLVCGGCGEAALASQRVVHAREESIQRAHDRCDLGGRARQRHGVERSRLAPLDAMGELGKRSKAVSDEEAQQQQQRGYAEQAAA